MARVAAVVQQIAAVTVLRDDGVQFANGRQRCGLHAGQSFPDRDRQIFLRHIRDYSFWCAAARLRGVRGTALASSAVTVCRRMKFVEPEAWRVPATTPSTSAALR